MLKLLSGNCFVIQFGDLCFLCFRVGVGNRQENSLAKTESHEIFVSAFVQHSFHPLAELAVVVCVRDSLTVERMRYS